MQIKSNALVKFIVPAVVIAGLAVGLKSCKNEPAEPSQAKQSGGPRPKWTEGRRFTYWFN